MPSRDVVASTAATDRVRPVQEILAVAQGAFGALMNRDDDAMDVVVTGPICAPKTMENSQNSHGYRSRYSRTF